ncbi:hypothetical protein VCRA2127O344_30220 [Vibrio crassostreae]|nr:hypothetical protein VCRA2127O344_30220 [Vibrio crassostreae]
MVYEVVHSCAIKALILFSIGGSFETIVKKPRVYEAFG